MASVLHGSGCERLSEAGHRLRQILNGRASVGAERFAKFAFANELT